LNGNFIQQLIQKLKSIKLNQNLLVFGFFLLISSLFWFFNALNKEYYADIQVPITYTNLPENKLVAGPLAGQVNVKITAYGHEVMNYKTTAIKSAVINLSQHSLHLVSLSEANRFYILTSTIKEEIAAVLGPEVEINKIEPDSLILKLEEVISKKVPVISNLQIDFKKQFMLKEEVVLFPDSVKIKGVKSELDSISFVLTDSLTAHEVDDSMNFMVNVLPIVGTEITPQMVNCIVQVEKFTELSYNIPIKVINVPKSYSVKLFPAVAKITCNVSFSNYQSIYQEQFNLVADYTEIENDNNARLRIRLESKPENISNIRLYPKAVDYIVEKND